MQRMRAETAGEVATMGWIYLESLIALFVLLGIVWWTMAPSCKPRAGPDSDPDRAGGPKAPPNDN
jgi:hypothetical protein